MKKILTTFETAKFLSVSPYTIRLWIIKGLLPAYSTPGGHRRIKLEELDNFLKKNRMPIPEKFFNEKWRSLLVGFGPEKNEIKRLKEWLAGFQCIQAESEVETGFLLLKIDPQIMLFNLDAKAISWRETAKIIKNNPELSHIHMLGVSGGVTQKLSLEAEKAGFYNVLSKPVSQAELKNCLNDIFGTLRF
jgi:excisionase family DNA binding protein